MTTELTLVLDGGRRLLFVPVENELGRLGGYLLHPQQAASDGQWNTSAPLLMLADLPMVADVLRSLGAPNAPCNGCREKLGQLPLPAAMERSCKLHAPTVAIAETVLVDGIWKDGVKCPSCGGAKQNVIEIVEINATGSRYVEQCQICRKPSPVKDRA